MKKIVYLLVGCFCLLVLVFHPGLVQSQPEPPRLPENHTMTGNQRNAGAPLNGGPGLLILMGLGYGCLTVIRKKRAF
jgi:hypothetical protein